jgi:hypothetical protein
MSFSVGISGRSWRSEQTSASGHNAASVVWRKNWRVTPQPNQGDALDRSPRLFVCVAGSVIETREVEEAEASGAIQRKVATIAETQSKINCKFASLRLGELCDFALKSKRVPGEVVVAVT